MRKFTIKDFITYNNPCFSCGNKISIRFGSANTISQNETVFLTPIVNIESVNITLKITYASSLKLKIFSKSNKIQTTSPEDLTKYLREHNLFVRSYCDRCHSSIESSFLEFNISKGFIYPFDISNELLIIKNKQTAYNLSSSFFEEKSILMVDKLDKNNYIAPLYFNLPLMPLYRFKDREHFLNKMKLYVVFS